MTKEEMLTFVIQKFGFEAKETIQFAEAMERLGLNELKILLKETLAIDITIKEDD